MRSTSLKRWRGNKTTSFSQLSSEDLPRKTRLVNNLSKSINLIKIKPFSSLSTSTINTRSWTKHRTTATTSTRTQLKRYRNWVMLFSTLWVHLKSTKKSANSNTILTMDIWQLCSTRSRTTGITARSLCFWSCMSCVEEWVNIILNHNPAFLELSAIIISRWVFLSLFYQDLRPQPSVPPTTSRGRTL